MPRKPSLYLQIIEKIFVDRYTEGASSVPFVREDILDAAKTLNLPPPKNPGDVIYSKRYRSRMPQPILDTQPEGMEWIIEGTGRSKYSFRLVKINLIEPNTDLITIKIPDATPEIVARYSLSDEQALLAKVRYNRLIDVFLGITTYSLQNHLRTSHKNIGQLEIDELYIGVNQNGCHFVLPVQAKGGTDRLSTVQTNQDILWCQARYPDLICRAVSTQFIEDNLIALFELTLQDSEVKIVQERHYRLLPSDQIDDAELRQYRTLS